MSAPYVELHAHSAFSFLDGASTPEELAEAAASLGYHAMALTDHDGVSGSLAFAHAARDRGLRPITGCEITLATGHHLTLIAATAVGYSNLCRIITSAHSHTRDTHNRRATSPQIPIEQLAQRTDGLICLTGCARNGLLAQPITDGNRSQASIWLTRLTEWFGAENVYVEIQQPHTRGTRHVMRDLCALARQAGLRTVATGNVHAHHPHRAFVQDTFVAIANHQTLDGSTRARRGNRSAILRSPDEMAELFADIPDAIAATYEIAERCTFDLTRDLRYRFPDFFGTHAGQSAQDALAGLCIHQLGAYYPNAARRAIARARLDQELGLIAHHGLAGFFLLHRDILELARDIAHRVRPQGSARCQLPPGRGRGSSVGSIICYLTGLSHIDPIANNLFLGRFLNYDMSSVPDIDLDFPRDIREHLITAVIKKYGSDHAALVAAFPTFKARMAIRELGRALALPDTDLTRLSRLTDGWSSAEGLERDITRLPDGAAKLRSPRWRALVFLAQQASGLPRHLSQHSGGMIVSAQPLIDMVPILPAATHGRQICQWDKNSCADAGFVKIDLLGLGMLSAVEECVDLIARSANTSVNLSKIDFFDPDVYTQIQAADTVGTFQIESRAQMQSLLQTRPENLDDLTVQVALIRPGPVSGGAVHPYIAHRRARRADPNFVPPYDHPLLAPILEETLGVIVFQEQVLEVAMALAGFTPGKAEALRRAMSRTRSREAMLTLWDEFRDGAREKGVDDHTIEIVFAKLVGFANFGFPKAHSAAFAVLAYQSAWLRRYYPAQFLAALLNAQPMGFYPPASLVRDAQRRGVRVASTCIQASQAMCTLTDDGAVRIGLAYVRDVRHDAADTLVAERVSGGPFTDLADLAARSTLTRPQLAQLIRAGACDVFGHPRRELLWQLAHAQRPTRHAAHTQLALPLTLADAPALAPQSRFERTVSDYETMGLSTGWHLISLVRPQLPRSTRTNRELADLSTGTSVTIAGMVTARQRPATAHGILFVLIEDETGLANVIVRPECYERYRSLLRAEPLILVEGRLERRGRVINVIAEKISRIAAPNTSGEEDPGRAHNAVPAGQHFGHGRRGAAAGGRQSRGS